MQMCAYACYSGEDEMYTIFDLCGREAMLLLCRHYIDNEWPQI